MVSPSITAQPSSATVTEGDAASFSVAASGTGPFGYARTYGVDKEGGLKSTRNVNVRESI